MAVSSHGTLLKIGDGANPEVFSVVAEVLDISGPGVAVSTDAWRTDDSTAYPLVVPMGVDPGEILFEVNYTAHATQHMVRDAAATQALTAFRVQFPTTPVETLAFTGYVTGFDHSAPVEGVLRASVIVTLASHLTTV